ncbi:MAG: NADPH-dependent oxidoreductase [Bacteroidetes bacterium GWE2_29_8]|nr:MAG: NADPH-dependent oxidoreductase [Bacteroidetes bacterium GWE2_29_8]OFY20796.1 MAG: NADPH-dependent oxidoreductase [Bacteroidetes bacterium GWF2_29_10]
MLETILKHRTIRKYDKNKDVESEKLNKILEAAFRAPTTGNMQVYSIIVSKDIEMKNKLLPIHFNQQMIVEAPVILTFFADFNRFNKWCNLRNAKPGYNNYISFMTGAIDSLLAAQNACIAAEDLGLGTCYLGTTTYNADKLINLFNCPKDVVPITTLVIGYPLEIPDLTDRLPAEAIVHYETYKDYSEEDINRIYAEKEALPQTKELVIQNQLENLAQIFTNKRYTKKDNEFFSEKFMNIIKEQNF